jgi:hypothetical protein
MRNAEGLGANLGLIRNFRDTVQRIWLTQPHNISILDPFTLADFLLDPVRNHRIPDDEIRRASEGIGLPPKFIDAAPLTRLRMLADLARAAPPEELETIRDFMFQVSQIGTLRLSQSSLPGVASALRHWGRFANLWDFPPFPPTPDAILAWSSCFNMGGTFAVYANHLRCACTTQGIGIEWFQDPRVRAIVKGLKKADLEKFRPKMGVSRELLKRFVTNSRIPDALRTLCWLSYAFLLRMGSEALELRKAPDWSTLGMLFPLPAGVAGFIGLRERDGRRVLVIRLRKRKNMQHGSMISRQCSCRPRGDTTGSFLDSGLCPVCALWPAIRRLADPGALLFRTIEKGSVNATIKRFLTDLMVQHANFYGTHSWRRGAVREILARDQCVKSVTRHAQWKSVRTAAIYADFETRHEGKIREILQDLSSDSE